MIFISPIILSMNQTATTIINGAAVVNHGVIQAVGPAGKILRCYPGHRRHHLTNAVLMPGLINLHTHTELPPLLERVHAKTFPDWIINLIRAKKDLNKQDYVRSARENIDTLIHTGTTTVGEICTHHVSPALLKQSGLRATIFHEIITMGPRIQNQESRIHLPVLTCSALIKSGFSPHSPYTVSEPVLRAISRVSRGKGVHIAMHIAESEDEIRLLQRKKNGLENLYRHVEWDLGQAPQGDSSIEYLKGIGFLSANLLAVHAVHITGKDIDLIRKSNISIAHCPRSNKETGVGKMPIIKLIEAGVTVGLGTDSLASSPSLNLWDEMRYAYQIHRKAGISAEDIFKFATINGAKALGLNKEIGSIERGKKADIIAVPLPKRETGDIYSDLLRETQYCMMNMVNGKMLPVLFPHVKI